MHARPLRRLSHAPLLRVLALLAWLAMACVPAVASARACMAGEAGHAAVMHAPTMAHAGDCCHGHAGTMAGGHCDACAASATGLILPASLVVAHGGFATPSWPVRPSVLVPRPAAPPLRPPRI